MVAGVCVHRYYSPAVIWKINPVAFIARGLLDSRPDIVHVHSHLYTLSNQAALVRCLRAFGLLCHIHGGVGIPPYRDAMARVVVKRLYDSSLGRLTITRSDLVASVSHTDLSFLAARYNIPSDSLIYLPNAVDTELFTPAIHRSDPDSVRLLFIGDLEKWKGIDLLLRWVRKESDTVRDNITLSFVGQGSLRKSIVETSDYCSRKSSRIRVEFVGPKTHREIPDLMKHATALVLPSYWEGLPTVILEAMASGLPVISTLVGDVPSVVRDGKTGLVIDRTTKSLSQAVGMVMEQPEVLQRISANALNLVRTEYSIERAACLVEKAYERLMSGF